MTESFGRAAYQSDTSEGSVPHELPPQERRAVENKERFVRLREHKRLSEFLASAYQSQAQYANGGSCAGLRAKGITGLCDEVSSPFPDVSPEIQRDALTSGDEGFGRRAAAEAAKWRDIAKSDKDEIDAMCQSRNARCDTSEAFKYWQEGEDGKVISEDVEMLNLASTVTKERMIAYMLGSVSSGDLFAPSSNGGNPVKEYELLNRIEELPNLPVAPKGYYEGESVSLSDQAVIRKRLLTEAGLKDLEAIQ